MSLTGKHRIRRQIGELLGVDDVPDLVVSRIGLEIVLDRGNRQDVGFFRLVIGHELGELFFQQFVLRLEARDESEDFLQNLPQSQTPIHGGGLPSFSRVK